MNTARLEQTLTPSPELEALAREVRAGTVQLDWTDVREAPLEALSILLAGCDLIEDAEALGMSTIPAELSGPVLDVLLGNVAPPIDTRAGSDERPAHERRAGYGAAAGRDGTDGDRSHSHGDERTLKIPTPWELRDELQDLVLRDLLGPADGPEEEVDEVRVSDRYLLGMLGPGRQPAPGDADDALAGGTDDAAEDGAPEPDTAGPRTLFPASFGLSFAVDGEATVLRVTARWGRYERTHSAHLTNDTGAPKPVWKRIPVEGVIEDLPLRHGPIPAWKPALDYPDVIVRGRIRRTGDSWLVTLFLVNDQHGVMRQKDSAWLFQPELSVEDPEGRPIFLHRPYHAIAAEAGDGDLRQEEEEEMAMLYRHHLEFAVGHGVGVHADLPEGRTDRASRLATRVVPAYDGPITEGPTAGELPALEQIELDMKTLAALDRDALQRALRPLLSAYADWIEMQRARIAGSAAGLEPFGQPAERAVEACERALSRIEEGIRLLERDDRAFEAFRFANRAMWQQRVRTMIAERVRRGGRPQLEEIDVPRNRSWRLFQLAFILLNLPGITDLHHPDRDTQPDATADLLWFPTGGGKTEAYLGLTAYTLGLRRLQGEIAGYDGEHGVAVLMRYTLRLLTLQQFQRAAALICACERIRLDAWFDGDIRWGAEPFRIGLWVGNRTTPNWIDDAGEAIKRDHGSGGFRARAVSGSGTPAQLTNCPWCGQRIDPGTNIKVDPPGSGRGRVLTYCGDPLGQCPFSERQSPDEGLPVMVVDEEIYRYLPALLISTVDKFAQMPWRGETQMLFGRVSGRCERHGFRSPDVEDKDTHPPRGLLGRARTVPAKQIRPPDLIIQDELHLISGPLGTLVGTYETAIDELATWQVDGRRVRPKVIASTATVRRAPEQMRGLFLRRVEVFPPHGLDIDDNFFSRQRPSSPDHPGRRYIGICAPGRRLKAALIRVYVAQLAAAQLLYERHGAAADPWMTLVGYFNSMRELGGMRRVVDDDVRSRLRRAQDHGLAVRRSHHVEELTSRKSSTDIPEVLDLLEQRFDPKAEQERNEKRKRGIKGLSTPIDVLLATNMLSVGVDVQRLGLMVVAGQPKTTAEYIQATSRVGRRFPGLICTVYNWARPRDLSHYERFEHYHATFYQQVEALSVTPFSPRARDRSLSALLVSLVRLQGTALNANGQAARVRPDDPTVQRAVEAIVQRAWQVTGREEVREQVRRELEERLEEWMAQAEYTVGGRKLGYQDRRDGVTVGLLRLPSTDGWGPFTCLNSLRDVEPEVGLILDDYGMDNEPPYSRDRVPPEAQPALEGAE